jgi:hypothetical protein
MAFKLMGKLSLDGAAFKRGLAKAKASVKSFGARMKSALKSPAVKMGAAMAVALIAQQVKKTIDWGTKIRDLGVKFNVSTGFLQQMEYAAGQTGVTIDTLMKAYKKMAIVQADALDPSKGQAEREQYQAYFKKLGVTLKELQTLNPQDLFYKVAEGVKEMDMNAIGSQQIIAGTFGKSGIDMVNTFRVGLSGLADEFERMGLSVPDDTIQRLGAAGDDLEKLAYKNRLAWAGFMGWFFETWDKMMSHITATAEGAIRMLEAVSKMTNTAGFAWGLMMMKDELGGATRDDSLYDKRYKAEMRRRKKEREDAWVEKKKSLVKEGEAEMNKDDLVLKKQQMNEREKARLAAAAAQKQAWQGFKADKLERIGGSLGMKTTQLNVSMQQLALMKKADTDRDAIKAATVQMGQVIKGG